MNLRQKRLEEINKKNATWHKPIVGRYSASIIYDIVKGKFTPEDFFKTKEFDDTAKITMDIGNMYHHWIQEMYSPDRKEIKVEINCKEFVISGRIDLMSDAMPVEIKTCSTLPSRPKIEHKYQMMCYLKALKAEEGVINYIEKHKTDYPERNFKIKFDETVWQEIVSGVDKFHKEVKKEALKLI